MSSFSIELPLDSDGFLRRECPACRQEFKWHWGPTASRPEGEVDPPLYWCPLCGQSAPPDAWWTQAQLDYQQAVAMSHAGEILNGTMKRAFRGVKGISFKANASGLPVPDSLHEPDDMLIVEPPCHPWEPVKVPEEYQEPFHCLLCGARFAV